MGGIGDSGLSSLKRLKSLNDDGDLAQQLDEAQRLCNHGARAEMVLRWLLDQIRRSTNTRLEPRTWDLLTTASGLVSIDKLATHLKPCDILRIIQITLTLDSDKLPKVLIRSITSFCHSLQNISLLSNGAPVRALLTTDAEAAASYLGIWLRTLFQTDSNGYNKSLALDDDQKHGLTAALDIWQLHRPDQNADHAFSRECLLPITIILSRANRSPITQSTKVNDQVAYVETFESLLARHIFLPARNAFLQGTKHRTQTGELSKGNSDLSSLLQPLSSAGEIETATPALLVVALRCIPTGNLRQRQRETPWVEALFKALKNLSSETNVIGDAWLLAQLLTLMNDYRYNLSKDMLGDLADEQLRHIEGDDDTTNASWQLISQIAQQDPDVFLESAKSRALFKLITAADGQSCEVNLSTQVLTPVMKAFANQRQTSQFMQLWHEQLILSSQKGRYDSPWTELRQATIDIFDGSQTVGNFQKLVNTYLEFLPPPEAIPTNFDASDIHHEIFASIVVLEAIISAITDEEIVNALLPTLELALQNLTQLCGVQEFQSSALLADRSFWSFLTTLLNLWCPRARIMRGVASTTDDHVVALLSKKNSIDHGPIKISRKLISKNKIKHSTSLTAEVAGVPAADHFLMTALHYLSTANAAEITTQCQGILSKVIKYTTAILKYPNLISVSDNQTRLKLWNAWLASDETEDNRVIALNALLEASAMYATDSTSDFCNALIEELSSENRSRSLIAAKTLISNECIRFLSKKQKRLIVDTVTRQLSIPVLMDIALCHSRISLVTSILETVGSTSGTLLDLSDFLRLIDPSHDHKRLLKEKHSPKARSIDEPLWPSYLRLLETATKHLFGNRELMEGLASSLGHYCKALAAVKEPALHTSLFASIRVLLVCFTSNTDLDIQLDSEAVSAYLNRLISMNENFGSVINAQDAHTFRSTLQNLDACSQSVLNAARMDVADFRRRIVNTIQHITCTTDDNADGDITQIKSLCIKLACKWNPDEALPSKIDGMIRILRGPLSINDEYDVLQSFKDWIRMPEIDCHMRYAITSELQARLREDFEATSLLLITTLSSYPNSDVETSGKAKFHSLFDEIIQEAYMDRDFIRCRRACDVVMTILREKPTMTNQYTIEQCFPLIKALIEATEHSNESYLLACRIFTIILQQYRSRIRDRMHLVLIMLQTFITNLFRPTMRSLTLENISRRSQPRPQLARSLSRALQLLCNPPTLRSRSKTSDLIDQARRAQANVGSFLHPVLHQYCSDILGGGLADDVREELQPGIWAMIEAMEVDNEDAIAILSSAMDNSERAILRSVYDQYKTAHKRIRR